MTNQEELTPGITPEEALRLQRAEQLHRVSDTTAAELGGTAIQIVTAGLFNGDHLSGGYDEALRATAEREARHEATRANLGAVATLDTLHSYDPLETELLAAQLAQIDYSHIELGYAQAA